jgi:antitoxin component of MazEF toxin-antitoxin module
MVEREKGKGVRKMAKINDVLKELGLTEDRAIAILRARVKTLGRAKSRREEVAELREIMKANPELMKAVREGR